MKAATENINRRSLIKFITAATAVAALGAASAAGQLPADPVLAAIAERTRLDKITRAAGDRLMAVHNSLPPDAFGNPVITTAIARQYDFPMFIGEYDRFGKTPIRRRCSLDDIRRLNAHTEGIVTCDPNLADIDTAQAELLAHELAKRKAQGAARLAWWRKERRRQVAAKVRAGYYRAEREEEATRAAYWMAHEAVPGVAATTWAGVLAKLRLQNQLFEEDLICNKLLVSAIADADRLLSAAVPT